MAKTTEALEQARELVAMTQERDALKLERDMLRVQLQTEHINADALRAENQALNVALEEARGITEGAAKTVRMEQGRAQEARAQLEHWQNLSLGLGARAEQNQKKAIELEMQLQALTGSLTPTTTDTGSADEKDKHQAVAETD